MKTLFIICSDKKHISLKNLAEQLKKISPHELFDEIILTTPTETLGISDLHIIPKLKQLDTTMTMGLGAQQKLAYRYAVNHGFDTVVSLYWDDESNLEGLPVLINTIKKDEKMDVAFGISSGVDLKKPRQTLSRFAEFVFSPLIQILTSNKGVCWPQTCLAFRISALRQIPFELNANGAHFNFEILLQAANRHLNIAHVKFPKNSSIGVGLPMKWNLLINSFKAALKYYLRRYNLFFDIRYELSMDLAPSNSAIAQNPYEQKMDSISPHSLVCSDNDLIPANSYVLDIGCSTGYICKSLEEKKNCTTEGIDFLAPGLFSGGKNSIYHQLNLENNLSEFNSVIETSPCDVVILLDIIEHLSHPELFLINLYQRQLKKNPKFLISTGNVAFFIVRIMLLFGFFSYGKKGILDITHKRLFSLRTFRNLMEQTGFLIQHVHYFPLPFRSMGWPDKTAKFFERINMMLIRLSPSLFAYQIMFEAQHLPAISTKEI